MTGLPLYTVQHATGEQVNRAVFAANRVQGDWAAMNAADRAAILRKAAHLLSQRLSSLAVMESRDTGRPISETKSVDINSAIDAFNYYAGVIPTIAGEHLNMPNGNFAYTRREPLGVTCGIGAWNYPLQGLVWKLAPALACGNTFIFKASEHTALTALELAHLLVHDAKLPEGVFSVVLGGSSVGDTLVGHSQISKVSFTGSSATGKLVYQNAAATLKKVTMELGGKSPLIVFEDADLDDAVVGAMVGNFYSSGQVCSNGTRVFVHKSIIKQFTEKVVERTKKLKLGDPLHAETEIGPLIHLEHLERVENYIKLGLRESAKLLCGGRRSTRQDLANGYFMEPTIFGSCHDNMTIVNEEIFGPVMSILPFSSEEEVIVRANKTPFGLSAGVFTNNLARAHRVIASLQAGTCWINNYNVAPIELPWGGYKQSGLGRENGLAAIEHWTQLKSVFVELKKIEDPFKK